MNLTLTISWTPDEIKSITDFIHSKDSREKSLFSTIAHPPQADVAIVRKRWTPKRRAVDILTGSIESWFGLWKSYNTLEAAAHAIWAKCGANIYHYLKYDKVYKEVYKFRYHDTYTS